MELKFRCAHCARRLEADAGYIGVLLACPNCGFEVTVPQAHLGPGVTLGGFRLERRLGKGAMGEVFLATQLSVDRQVALKVLPGRVVADSNYVERFFQEIRMAAKLEHPNIVTAYDAGQDHGYYFFAMAYVEGENLGQKLARCGTFPEPGALKIVAKVAAGLAYAWQHGNVLHRDIKPSNIMLNTVGEPLIMDLGIAKSMQEDSKLTSTGIAMGTPHYMSPEQARGMAGLDFRTDMYSLGATLFHILSGTVPFDGHSAVEVVTKHLHDPLPSIRQRAPGTSQACEELLTRMMAKAPARRYASWESCIADIEAVIHGKMPKTAKARMAQHASERLVVQRQVTGGGASPNGKQPSFWQKDGWIIAAMGTLLALIFVLLVIAVWHRHEKAHHDGPWRYETRLRAVASLVRPNEPSGSCASRSSDHSGTRGTPDVRASWFFRPGRRFSAASSGASGDWV